GEHGISTDNLKPLFGLSPLARGTLCRNMRADFRLRFIPAGAGNTFN
ncbi:hypothetical protein SEEN978_10648, partial [Salmonella enterica subsp. enterica serovar Newport str. CVM 37978]